MPPQEAGGGGGGGGDNGMKHQHPNSASVISREQKTVCVMDASGSLGSELVKTLLQRGYFVHAALQSHSKGKLQSMKVQCTGDEKQNLKIFHADLLDYHSILDTLSGCSALFYIFEPRIEHPIYDEYMADIEVRAAHNVLEACAQTPTIDKVIFTSSATAVVWTDTRDGASLSCDVDEKSWSDINFCKKFKLWHALSKTLAEKTAWALAMDRGVSMVSANGGLLLDNNLRKTSATHPAAHNSKQSFPSYLKGAAEMYENGVLVAVDLWFLVDAHICIFEEISSYGRYLCFNHVINCHKDAVKLASMFMSSPPQSSEDTRVYPQRISNKKLNELMVNFDGQFQQH
ncbi:cinnamoyl-CoA reductase 2-like [Chenopodium quinoa]|uniref:cinnamoyl-CoA reductase 2-like n=1 Tax=Chenopodium quinoa TaxID=63459 RepID=UPI000B79A89E|nr:cinnamoyl-CoA reductase 2-like [Chenopodium quinoa]